MRISVKFGYEARVRTASHDSVRRSYVEDFDIDIPEILSDAAPEVVRTGLADGANHAVTRFRYGERHRVDSRGYKTQLRQFDGALYSPVTRSVYQGENGWNRETVPASALADGDVRPLFPSVRAITATAEVKRRGPPRAGTVEYGDRDQAVGEMERLAAALLLVDGILYRRQEEPLYVARAGHVDLVTDLKFEDAMHAFRLDELDFAVTRAALLGEVMDNDVTVPAVEVVDPGFMCRAPDVWAIIAAGKALDRHVAKRLPWLPIQAMMAFSDLRETLRVSDTVRVSDPDPDTGPVRGQVEAMCAHLDAAGEGYGQLAIRDVLRVSERRRQAAEPEPGFAP